MYLSQTIVSIHSNIKFFALSIVILILSLSIYGCGEFPSNNDSEKNSHKVSVVDTPSDADLQNEASLSSQVQSSQQSLPQSPLLSSNHNEPSSYSEQNEQNSDQVSDISELDHDHQDLSQGLAKISHIDSLIAAPIIGAVALATIPKSIRARQANRKNSVKTSTKGVYDQGINKKLKHLRQSLLFSLDDLKNNPILKNKINQLDDVYNEISDQLVVTTDLYQRHLETNIELKHLQKHRTVFNYYFGLLSEKLQFDHSIEALDILHQHNIISDTDQRFQHLYQAINNKQQWAAKHTGHLKWIQQAYSLDPTSTYYLIHADYNNFVQLGKTSLERELSDNPSKKLLIKTSSNKATRFFSKTSKKAQQSSSDMASSLKKITSKTAKSSRNFAQNAITGSKALAPYILVFAGGYFAADTALKAIKKSQQETTTTEPLTPDANPDNPDHTNLIERARSFFSQNEGVNSDDSEQSSEITEIIQSTESSNSQHTDQSLESSQQPDETHETLNTDSIIDTDPSELIDTEQQSQEIQESLEVESQQTTPQATNESQETPGALDPQTDQQTPMDSGSPFQAPSSQAIEPSDNTQELSTQSPSHPIIDDGNNSDDSEENSESAETIENSESSETSPDPTSNTDVSEDEKEDETETIENEEVENQ